MHPADPAVPLHPRLLSTCVSWMRSVAARFPVKTRRRGRPAQRSCLDLPREPQGIIACCNPVPPLVRQQVNELHLLVQQARETPLLKVREDSRQQGETSSLGAARSAVSRGDPVTQCAFFIPL